MADEPIHLLSPVEEERAEQRRLAGRLDATVTLQVARVEMLDRRLQREAKELEPSKLRNLVLARAKIIEDIGRTLDLAERLRPPEEERTEWPTFGDYDIPEPPDGQASSG
jgi:hypothetical protein